MQLLVSSFHRNAIELYISSVFWTWFRIHFEFTWAHLVQFARFLLFNNILNKNKKKGKNSHRLGCKHHISIVHFSFCSHDNLILKLFFRKKLFLDREFMFDVLIFNCAEMTVNANYNYERLGPYSLFDRWNWLVDGEILL